MRFLIFTQYYPPEIGAASTRLDAMARELRDLGHEVEIVTALANYPKGEIFPEYRGSFYRREMRNGIEVHRVWVYASVGSGMVRMLNYCSFCVTAIVGLSRAKKPDYLFVESPPLMLSVPAYLYSVVRGVPFILNIADLWPDTIAEMGLLGKGIALDLLYWLERWSYRKAAYVNAVTEGLRNDLLEKKNVPREKVLFLPNGADTRRYRPEPEDAGLKERLGLTGKQIVLYAGTLGRAHGLEHVLEAAHLLQSHRNIHFLFLGDGSERAALESLQKRLELSNVTFLDPVSLEQLAPYHSIAECGLVSLRNIPIFEGARPSKMFPMLASGKPIIFFGNGEGARLIERANAGIVVPAENAPAFAEAVSRLFSDRDLTVQLGANGRKFVELHHQWSKLVTDWVASLPACGAQTKSSGLEPARTTDRV
ncbi:MAG TPA: glycosyltransferase family 4 protein [Candidatus Acidoferrum sp.]|nr:glycosyltransferase family 4 protein [Candidatus Acidoferrum sp.]